MSAALLLSAYPAFVLGYTWSHVARANLQGGKMGPLDAYRHTLASAVVAFTLSPRAVDLTTWVMEGSADPADQMDRHNNRIGAAIGSGARSFRDLAPAVHEKVAGGAVNASDADQVTWLPPELWRQGLFW